MVIWIATLWTLMKIGKRQKPVPNHLSIRLSHNLGLLFLRLLDSLLLQQRLQARRLTLPQNKRQVYHLSHNHRTYQHISSHPRASLARRPCSNKDLRLASSTANLAVMVRVVFSQSHQLRLRNPTTPLANKPHSQPNSTAI